MKATTLAIAAAMAAGGAVHAQEAVQWRVEDGGNGHWYALIRWEYDVTWVTARDWAVNHGGHLVTMTSAQEDAFATSVALSQPWPNPIRGPYIGAFSTTSCGSNSCYYWVTGEPFEYTRWHPGNPDASPKCPGLVSTCFWDRAGTQAWQDVDACHSLTSFRLAVVEWSADCNGDGIVDYGQCRDGSLPDYNGNNIPDCCEQGLPCEVGNYPVQWRVEDGGNGHWYQLVMSREPLTQEDARQQAIARGGDLLSACGTEFDWVVGADRIVRAAAWVAPSWQPNDLLGPWIGLRVVGDSWAWMDNSACTFDRWDESCGQPDGLDGAAALYSCGFGSPASPGGLVHDIWSDAPAVSYLAEYSADCNGDGIVDYGQILDGTVADANGNGVPDCCDEGVDCDPCVGDVNFDGIVNGADISVLLGFWGLNGKPVAADINKDGLVDGADLAQMLGSWGECP